MVRAYPFGICIMLLVAVVWAVDLSLRPYLMKIILNGVTTSQAQDLWLMISVPVILYLVMNFIMSSVFRLYGFFVEYKMIPPLRQRVGITAFTHLLGHSHRYYQNNFSGSLTNKVNDLVSSVPEILQMIIDRFFSHSLALVIAIFTLWQVNYKFALIVFAWTFLFILSAYYYSKRLSRLADDWSEEASILTGKKVDVLSNMLSVRFFAREKFERQYINDAMSVVVKAESKVAFAQWLMWLVYGYSFVIVQILTFYLLITGRMQGEITVGDFALVLGINIAIVDFLWVLAKEFSQFSKLLGKAEQALRTISVAHDIQDVPNAPVLNISKGEIVFDKVQFNYQDDDALFDNKSITIHPGEKVGLVGYSGSGKSTFVNLILRLFDVNQGRILIDGQDIAKVTQASLHQAIGMIPQDPSLFHRSLGDNIQYGKVDATTDEVISAAKKSHVHEFIHRLKEGYASLVGERGVKLSGGQRQRIAIARAMLKNAPILILDEATSQLDSVTEQFIQESLWELMQNKTTIVIAHRLSTLLHMDRILVFHQGKIVQDGKHAALLEQKGLYKTLWEAQIGGFLIDEEQEDK